MLRSGHFFGRMLASALVVLAPLVALHAYTLQQQSVRAEELAYQSVSQRALQKSKDVRDFLARTENLLAVLAARPDLAALDPQRCLDVLGGMSTIDPLYANIGVADMQGNLVCSATGRPSRGAITYAKEAWFADALRASSAQLSRPRLGRHSGAHVAFLYAPLRDGTGTQVGIVAVAIHLARIAELVFAPGLPPGASLTLVGPDSTVYSRFPDPNRWIGQPTSRNVQNLRKASPSGVVVGEGPDGVSRAYATEPLGTHDLRLAAGIPTEVIFAVPQETQRRSYWVAGGTMLLAAALIFFLARALVRPVRSLSRTVKTWSSGSGTGVRADESLPGEFRTLAQEFNAMIDAREASARQLAESERWYAALLDSADLVALNVAHDGSLLAGNDALWRLTGWRLHDLAGADWTQRLFPASQIPIFEEMRRSLSDAGTSLARRETDILTRDGAVRRIRWASAPSRDSQGQLLGMSSIGEDVTGKHEAEQARQASARAEASNQAKTEFLAHMSHELRTPLNAVLGFSQLLQMDPTSRLDAAQRQQLELIHLAGAQLRALIDDVLDVSQIESGRLSINLDEIDPRKVIDEVMRLSTASAASHHITLTAPQEAHPPVTLHTDPVRLRQVLLNFVSNGIKYNRPGGKVTIATSLDGDQLRITVTDDGLGMTPEQLSRLFEPFNRLGRETGPVAGTGIGMSLSRQLVRLLGGELQVDSSPVRGTRVSLTMKCIVPKPALADASQPDRGEDATALSGTVLYIEDNAANTMVVSELMARWDGVRLLLAQDGASGLAMAAQTPPDLVLLDMRLPDMHGTEVLARLREDPRTRHIPVVALSASAMPDEVAAARAAGAAAYWTKPIEFGPFSAGVSALLARRPGPQS